MTDYPRAQLRFSLIMLAAFVVVLLVVRAS